MPERLQDEPDPRSRATLFGFPAQLTAIRKPIVEFLSRVFEPTRYQTTAALRGFYFTSGMQEGTPLDAVIGALQRSYGVESFGASAYSGVGKSFFLHDLLTKVIFGEAEYLKSTMTFSSPVNSASLNRAPARCTRPWYSYVASSDTHSRWKRVKREAEQAPSKHLSW